MKIRLGTSLISIALIWLVASATRVHACSCMGETSVCQAFGGTTAVFVGRVGGGREQKTEVGQDGTKSTYDVGSIYFVVEEAFSGVKSKRRVTVHSGTGGGDCGYWFTRGQRYLVYAHGDEDGKLYTGICTRTRPLADAAEDLAFLRALPVEGTGVHLYGSVATLADSQQRETSKPEIVGLAGITITIKDAKGRRREVVSDSEGEYEVTGLKPGKYEVSAALPDYYYKDQYSTHKIEVFDRGCAEVNFAAVPDGQVSGRIFDSEGQPVKKARISLHRADTSNVFAEDDEVGFDYAEGGEGKFSIGQVAPGEYILGVNLMSSPAQDSPYPPTFYPGVTARSEASIIKVGLGEQLAGLVLRLPPKLLERTVQGLVVWPDGNPAVGVSVHLTDVNHPGYTTTGWSNKTDAQGRFTLTGFEGLTYRVQANGAKYPEKDYNQSGMTHAEPPKVRLTENVFGLKLVLTSEGAVCEHYEKEDKP